MYASSLFDKWFVSLHHSALKYYPILVQVTATKLLFINKDVALSKYILPDNGI